MRRGGLRKEVDRDGGGGMEERSVCKSYRRINNSGLVKPPEPFRKETNKTAFTSSAAAGRDTLSLFMGE